MPRLLLRRRMAVPFAIVLTVLASAFSPDFPVLSESYRGTRVARGATVILTPRVARGQRAPDPIIGTLAGTLMKVAYVVQEGAATRTLRRELRRDAGWQAASRS